MEEPKAVPPPKVVEPPKKEAPKAVPISPVAKSGRGLAGAAFAMAAVTAVAVLLLAAIPLGERGLTGGQGPSGPMGPPGSTGPQGPKGPPGQDGQDAPLRPAFVFGQASLVGCGVVKVQFVDFGDVDAHNVVIRWTYYRFLDSSVLNQTGSLPYGDLRAWTSAVVIIKAICPRDGDDLQTASVSFEWS